MSTFQIVIAWIAGVYFAGGLLWACFVALFTWGQGRMGAPLELLRHAACWPYYVVWTAIRLI